MKKSGVKTIVAIGIGAALFFVFSTYITIPTPIPNLRFSIHYGMVAAMSMIFGPLAGGLMSLIGHFLSDLAGGWGIWWSWIAGSTFYGVAMGLLGKKIKLDDGKFGVKEAVIFNVFSAIAHCISWGLIAPALDILIYAEPPEKLFIQGLVGSIGNIIASAIIGTLLCLAYVKARPKSGSLQKDA